VSFGKPLGNLMQSDILLRPDQSQDESLMGVELRAAWIAKAPRFCIAGLSPAPMPSASGRNANGKAGRRLPCR
jgi:hypothetical protein